MSTTDSLLKWFPIISVVISCLIGGIGWTAWVARNVPQTSYIDDLLAKELKYIDLKSAESMKYTDEKVNALRAEAFAHSDINRSSMESEYKGLSAKLDMLIMMVTQQQAQIRRK